MSPVVTPGSRPPVPTIRDVKSYADLRSLSDEELERRLDATLQSGTVLHTNFYREEIARREGARREERMLGMTHALMWLTVAIGADDHHARNRPRGLPPLAAARDGAESRP
jgi:hypothetical protein